MVSDETRVLHVAEGRGEESLAGFLQSLTSAQKHRIQWVSMDMWKPYIQSSIKHLPHGDRKIAFDRFHVAKQFNEAVDFVRRKEHKALTQEGDHRLKNTKYHWLRGGGPRKEAEQERFDDLRRQELRTARAWAIKETAANLWRYRNRDTPATAGTGYWPGWPAAGFSPWSSSGKPSGTISGASSTPSWPGPATAWPKTSTTGSRRSRRGPMASSNRQRMINAIYFHLGGLNLYPPKATLTD